MNGTIGFAGNLKKLRRKHGLSRAALASQISYSEKAIEKWEDGSSTPPLAVLDKLAQLFCVSLEDLIYLPYDAVKYYLGIDGGGTKTAFLLQNANHQTVAECTLGSSNPIDIGMERCKRVLSSGIETVCMGKDKSEISLFAGISGVEPGEIQEELSAFLSSMRFFAVGVANDIENVIELSLNGRDGIAVICGTGITAYVVKSGKTRRIAGNGYLFDNGGSGYDIGRDAFEAAFEQLDGRGDATVLTDLLTQYVGAPLPLSLNKIYQGGKRYIAAAAPIVFDAYASGDAVAQKIIERNAAALARVVKAGLVDFDSPPVTVAICGGLCNYANTLKKHLDGKLPEKCNPLFITTPCVAGAVKRAEKQVN